ncbi:MAG: response regulator transcription factor [Balneolales bacterium]
MKPKQTILLVEDEHEPAEMLSNFLEMHKYRILLAPDGNQAISIIKKEAGNINLAILDIMVPGKDGREICRYIRKHPVTREIPVIFLTARDQEKDEIAGLSLGADDYIPKPASLNLIRAHVESLLRRHRTSNSKWTNFGNVFLNSDGVEVWLDEKKLDLTQTEFKILMLFFENPRRVYSRQNILELVNVEEKYVFDRTVDAHIKNIRLKLEDDGELIKTYRGTGYGLNKDLVYS